jgi:hypothetical protein
MFVRSMLILALGAAVAQAGEKKTDDTLTKAKTAVEKQITEWKGQGAKIAAIDEKVLREVFPKHRFVAAHYAIWPIAVPTPDPLKAQNVFAVADDGKVTHLADDRKLEEFFKSHLKSDANQDKTTRSYLRLRMEYVQDGYYKFKFPEKTKIEAEGSSVMVVSATAEVVPEMGNMGSFKAIVRFGRDDNFAGVTEENKVVRGMRPRCQATLLLHPEKLVREIAEQDLLVMGRNARGYLMEQRAKASDELRREIDRVWRQIEIEGR